MNSRSGFPHVTGRQSRGAEMRLLNPQSPGDFNFSEEGDEIWLQIKTQLRPTP